MKKLKVLISLACMLGVFSFANASAMEKKENKKTEFNAEKDLFENNLNEYKKEDKKEEIFDEIDTSSKSKKNEKFSEKKEENITEEIDKSSEKTKIKEYLIKKENEIMAEVLKQRDKQRDNGTYRSVMPGDVKIKEFTIDDHGNYPDAKIYIVFDFKQEELDLIEEDAAEYNDGYDDFYSFSSLIREVGLIFGEIPKIFINSNTPLINEQAESEERLSKFLKKLESDGKCGVFQIPARKRFRNIKELLPVLAEYIKRVMLMYKGFHGETDEWMLLKHIGDFISNFDVDIVFSADWGKFKEFKMFDGNFEGKVGIMFRDPTKKSPERQEMLKLIKEKIENFKQQNIEFRQTLAYRVLFAFFYVVMRENLHLNIDNALGINRDEYYEKKQEELMQEGHMDVKRHRKLKKLEKAEIKKRHKKLPKVECCVYVDPLLYGIGFNNEFEKDELFKLYQNIKIKNNGKNKKIKGSAEKGDKKNDFIKKHMEKNLKDILRDKSFGVKYNNTPEDFKRFFKAAYYTLTEKTVEGRCKYFDELFDPKNIRFISFSEDGSKLIFKFKAKAYYEKIFKILDFNNFVHSTNNITGVGKTSSYAERIAEIFLIYRIICEKKKLNDMKNEKLNESFSKYSNVNFIEESEDEKEESKNWFSGVIEEAKENSENLEDLNEIDTSSNKK